MVAVMDTKWDMLESSMRQKNMNKEQTFAGMYGSGSAISLPIAGFVITF